MVYLECKMKKYKYLALEKNTQGSCTLILNNPQLKNAINLQMISEFNEILETLKSDKKIRVLRITGAGNVFSAGADLDWMKKSRSLSEEQNKSDALIFTNLLENIDNFPKPTIAVINGHVFGGGLGIISVCDFSIANNLSKFCFSEVKLGLIPAMIGPYILRNIGYKKAKSLFLTGEVFNSDKALEIGLIDVNTTEDKIEEITNNLVNKLLAGSPSAQEEIKTFTSAINQKKISKDLINFSAEVISKIRVNPEAKEGIDAFLEKRKPKWNN